MNTATARAPRTSQRTRHQFGLALDAHVRALFDQWLDEMRDELAPRPARSEHVTADEAAEILRCAPQRIYDLASAGTLTRYREDGARRVLYLRAQVEGLIVPDDRHPDARPGRHLRAAAVTRGEH